MKMLYREGEETSLYRIAEDGETPTFEIPQSGQTPHHMSLYEGVIWTRQTEEKTKDS
jgi:hypothetical protein